MRSGAEEQLRFTAPQEARFVAADRGAGSLRQRGRSGRVPHRGAGSTLGCWPPSPPGARDSTMLATDLRVEQRSLEDVFLDLTGKELRS